MSPEQARAVQMEIFRRMTPEQRGEVALRWTASVLDLARGGISTQHPDWTPEKIERELGRRITGIDVTKLDWEKIRRQEERRRTEAAAATVAGEGAGHASLAGSSEPYPTQ